jgi:hypothetical protein
VAAGGNGIRSRLEGLVGTPPVASRMDTRLARGCRVVDTVAGTCFVFVVFGEAGAVAGAGLVLELENVGASLVLPC